MSGFWPRGRAKQAGSHIVAPASGRRIAPGLIASILAAQKRERTELLAQLGKVRDLVPLLMKGRNGQRWTAADRATLRDQLRALAHLSPYLVITVMPGSFVALPLLAWWLDRRRRKRDA